MSFAVFVGLSVTLNSMHFCSSFLTRRLSERDEIWRFDGQWYIAGVEQFW